VIAGSESERLFHLQKIAALNVRGSRGPLGTLLERHAQQVLEIDPPPVSASPARTRAWRVRVREHAAALIAEIRATDDRRRAELARDLADLPTGDRVWGRDGSLPGLATRSAGRGTPASWR
jgi:hypothetical protein